jgi:hypothetical protein
VGVAGVWLDVSTFLEDRVSTLMKVLDFLACCKEWAFAVIV